MQARNRVWRTLPLAALLVAGLAATADAADRLKVLLIDGQNNHNWKAMQPVLVDALTSTGRFDVDVATTPPPKSPASAWDSFRPDFSKYAAVVSNYNGEAWPEPLKTSLEKYVSGGGGLVVVHAANNAFAEWPAWNEMIGMGWRDSKFGERLTVDDSGKVVKSAKGEGPGAGHGPAHAYPVVVRDADHPITKGMPARWAHPTDELYHGQRGPVEHMHILATAYSDKAKGGTGTNEPMAWTIPVGKGRVFTTVLGHVNGDDTTAIRCVGFQSLLSRGAEWAATGKVTLPLAADFPAEAVKVRPAAAH
ncbi:ThuA domain-containing protein [Isosphaeraceae bacterium EP7]